MNSPNLDPLIQQYRQAAAAQEELVERLRGTGQGTAEERNQQILDAARNTRAAEEAIERALPPGQTLRQVLGQSSPTGTPTATTPDSVNTPTSGTGAYLQRVLDANRLGNLGLQVQDNILNQYDRYTYKFGLYLVNDRDAEELDIGSKVFNNQVRKFTVAESGVTTGFNIVDVEIIDAVSSSHRNRNNVTSDINITITEPYGLTLVDRVFLASKDLGIMNWRMAPMILTLEMRAINVEGSPARDAALIRKAYKLVISDMNSQLTEVGSTYKITAAVSNAIGFKDQFYMLPMNLTITLGGNNVPTALQRQSITPATGSSGANPTTPQTTIISVNIDGSVGQFFTELGNYITAFYREARTRGSAVQSVPFVLYEFVVAPELAEQQLNFANTQTNNARRRGFTRQGQEVHVSRIGISELVDDILSSLANVNFFVPNNPQGTVRIPRVECRVEHVGWDGILNDYIRKFTYYITVMETVRPVPNPETGYNYQEGPQAATRQAERLRILGERKVVRKAYPYYYTGMNTEIISLDITFNQLHIIPLPLHNGETVTPADSGQSLQQRLRELIQNRNQLQAQIQQQQNFLGSIPNRLAQLQAAQTSGLGAITDPQLRAEIDQDIDRISQTPGRLGGRTRYAALTEALSRRIALLNTERSQIPTSIGTLQQQVNQFDSDISDLRNQNVYVFPTSGVSITGVTGNVISPQIQALINQRNAQAVQNTRLRADRRFIEDLNINDTVQQMGRLVYMASQQDIANNLARPPDTADPRQGEVRATYSTILAQMYDRVGLQLTEIEMEIRGDPYWLGETNLERLEELNRISADGSSRTFASTISQRTDQYANYHGQDAGFLLLFRAGNQPSESTGYMNFEQGSRENQSVFFNGLYLAIEVTHVFSNGKFTQKIRAQRDNLIDLARVGGAGASSSATGATGAATPVPPATTATTTPPSNSIPQTGLGQSIVRSLQSGSPAITVSPNAPAPVASSPSRRGAETRAEQLRRVQELQAQGEAEATAPPLAPAN